MWRGDTRKKVSSLVDFLCLPSLQLRGKWDGQGDLCDREKHNHVPVITLASLAVPLVSGLIFFFSLSYSQESQLLGQSWGQGEAGTGQRVSLLEILSHNPALCWACGLGERRLIFSALPLSQGLRGGSEGMARAGGGLGRGRWQHVQARRFLES